MNFTNNISEHHSGTTIITIYCINYVFSIGLQRIPIFSIQTFGCLNERIPNYVFVNAKNTLKYDLILSQAEYHDNYWL